MSSRRLVAALVLAACGSSAPVVKQAPPPPPTPTTPKPTAGPSDDLSLLPLDSEIVLGVDFAQLSHSDVWQKYITPKLTKIDGLQKFQALCGFDLLSSLKSVAIGIRDADKSPSGLIVLHGLDRAKSMTCFDNEGIAEVEKDGTKVVMDGPAVLITDKQGEHVGFTFVDDTTAVAVIGADGTTKDSVGRATDGTHGIKGSAAFAAMYNDLNKHDSIWLLARGSALSQLSAVGVNAKAVFGSMNVTDGVALDARIRFATPDETTRVVAMLQSQFANAQFKAFFDRLDCNSDGSDAHIVVAASHDRLATMAGMLGVAAGP
jgi:hypothetical protein